MLQVIAIGIAFLLFGMGSIANSLKVISTPIEKRTGYTGVGSQLIYAALGCIILILAIVQPFTGYFK